MSRVGQFLGRLFAGPSAKNETPLRAYGKLPLYAEYRRLELAPGTPTVFSQWMDAGRLAWVRAMTTAKPGAVRPSRLLIQLPDTREVVVATIWDSRDSLGRVFPFSFFVVCPLEALGDDPLQRWAAALALHEAFDRSHAGLRALGGGGDFYRLYAKRVLTLRPDDLSERVHRLHDEARKISTDEWFQAAGFGDDVKAGDWFSGAQSRIERWKAQPELVGELALSCPLARGPSYGSQALLWLALIGRFAEKAGRTPWLVVPADNERPGSMLHVIVRDPLPDDFQLLTTDARSYHYVENLAQIPTSSTKAEGESAIPQGTMLGWLANHGPPAS